MSSFAKFSVHSEPRNIPAVCWLLNLVSLRKFAKWASHAVASDPFLLENQFCHLDHNQALWLKPRKMLCLWFSWQRSIHSSWVQSSRFVQICASVNFCVFQSTQRQAGVNEHCIRRMRMHLFWHMLISLAIESFGFWYYLIHFDSFFCIYLLQYFDIMLLLATCHASPRSSDRWAPPRSGRRRKFIARLAAWSHRCCDLASHVTTLRPTLVLAQTSRHLLILMLMVTNTNTTQ